MDITSFDLEEMDEEEREELEAMLYAQVHHAAPDASTVVETLPPESVTTSSALPASKSSQLKLAPTSNQEVHSSLSNGIGHSAPPSPSAPSVERKTKTLPGSDSATNTSPPAATNVSASAGGTQEACDGAAPASELNNQQAVNITSPLSADDGSKSVSTTSNTATPSQPVIPVSSTPAPAPAPAEQAQPRSSPQPLPASVPDVASERPAAGGRKRQLSPASSGDEPETKTAALAASERRRRGRRPQLVTVHGSSSGSSTDECVVERGETRGGTPTAPPAAAAGVSPSAAPALARAARSGGSGSPDVVTIDESASPLPEVISLGDDSAPPTPEPAPSPAARTSAAAEPAATEPAVAAAEQGAGRRRQPAGAAGTAGTARRARSLGGPAAAEALRQRWVRTSSDLSSSGDDSDGGAALADDCDIRMNVRGAGPALSAAGRGVGGRRQAEQQRGTGTDSGLSLPPAACRGVLASAQLTAAERRLLKPLCASQPCHKWSERQRAGYSTPRHYGPEDVNRIQATMSDHGWDIPARYLQRSPGARSAKSRYYSNLTRNRCRRCDDIGHVMASCPLPPVCHLCGGKGHTGEFRCPNMFCYMCGRRDHPTRRCPRHIQPVFCALCKAAGHVSDECADRWRRHHATTAPGPVVQPPPSLENRPARLVHCWECGQRGHHGHHCGDERYTSAASLSQQVISYTAAACPSRAVSGLVATPAQMDAVFAPRRRRRIEQMTRATLTYEQLGDKSWMINISGSLEAARDAHEHVQAILQGKKRPRPRPSSAPSSPVHLTESEGATSAPVSPEPSPEDGPEDAAGAGAESKKAARQRRRQEKEARLGERRRKRRERAAAREQAVIDVDSSPAGDECSEVAPGEVAMEEAAPGEVTVVEEVSGTAAAAARRGVSDVELVTVVSEEEEDLSAGCEAGPALDTLTEAGRAWKLRLLDGDGPHDVNAEQKSAREAFKLSKRGRKKLRKKTRKDLAASADAEEAPSSAGTSKTPKAATEKKRAQELHLARCARRQLTPEFVSHLPVGWEARLHWRQLLAAHGAPYWKDQQVETIKKKKRERKAAAGKNSAKGKGSGKVKAAGKGSGKVNGAGKGTVAGKTAGKGKKASLGKKKAGKMAGDVKVKQENGRAPGSGSSRQKVPKTEYA